MRAGSLCAGERPESKRQFGDRIRASYSDPFTVPAFPLQTAGARLYFEESDGVDYSARLKPGDNGKMVFADPSYEAKPGDWKLCYRAGRETMEAARSFARSWLADLQKTN